MYKFAIIGCGRIAHRHAENIMRVGKLISVCDIDKNKADDFGALYNSKAWYSIDDLLKQEKEIDVICVCTPNGLHAEHSIKSLQGGKHVLCEKPMCIAMEAAWSMIDTAHFFRRKLYIIKQNRFNAPIQFVKKLLDDGKLGKISSFQLNCFWNRPQQYYDGGWRGSKIMDGGLLYTQFSHFIDLLYWFLGDVEEVTGYRKNSGMRNYLEFEDTGTAILKMKTGALGNINYTINSFQKNMEGSLTIFGEKGTVKIGGQYLNVLEYQQIHDHVIPLLPAGNKANEYGFYQGSMSNHDKVYQNLVDVIQHNAAMAASSNDGLKTVQIIEKIYAAAENL